MSLRRKVQLGALVALVLLALPAFFTEQGDYLGPLERTARAVLNGWDMWSTEAAGPYEGAMPPVPEGAVPVTGRSGYDAAARALASLDADTQSARGRKAYRQFCRHCHGPNGDGRTIVGESFDVPLPDLRRATLLAKGERDLFNSIFYGTENMIPLRESLAPADLLLAVRSLDELVDAPSRPYFGRKYPEPLEGTPAAQGHPALPVRPRAASESAPSATAVPTPAPRPTAVPEPPAPAEPEEAAPAEPAEPAPAEPLPSAPSHGGAQP